MDDLFADGSEAAPISQAPRRRRHDRPRRRLREMPISRLFPNLITLAGLCCGLSSIRFALADKWEISVAFILAAALIDGMDGRIARLLGATSTFGAQLDSLSDFVCFGVAPAIVLYLWQTHEIRGFGWAVVLFFAVCTALRLARFNTALVEENPEPWRKQFFTGVPSPAGGILCILPIFIFLLSENTFRLPAMFCAIYALIIATLMASRIPTFAGKNIHVRHEHILPLMLACGVTLVLMLIEPWLTVSVLSLLYLASIPFALRHYQRMKRANAQPLA